MNGHDTAVPASISELIDRKSEAIRKLTARIAKLEAGVAGLADRSEARWEREELQVREHVARLPTFADGPILLPPTEVWLVGGPDGVIGPRMAMCIDFEGGYWTVRTLSHAKHLCEKAADCYSTEQAAREAAKGPTP